MKEALHNLAPSSFFGIFSHKSIWVIHLSPTLSIPSHLLAFSCAILSAWNVPSFMGNALVS